jgi:hypothetical protein
LAAIDALILCAISSVGLGCGQRLVDDVYVQNTSEQVWLLRVPIEASTNGEYLIIKVDPDADGVAYRLSKGKPLTIDVLKPNCELAGAITPISDSAYGAPGVPGLEVTYRNDSGRSNTPEIEVVTDCGGTLRVGL